MSCSRFSALFKRAAASRLSFHPQSRVKPLHSNAFNCSSSPGLRSAVVQRRSLLRQQLFRSASNSTHPTRPPLNRAKDMVFGALILVGLTSAGSFIYHYSGKITYEKVPLTNRPRMLWTNREFDEELGHPIENWLLNMREKPRLSEDDPVTKLVREVLNELLKVDVAKGLNFKLYVFDDFADPNAYGAPALEGGRIFINTGCIHSCKKVEELAAVLAHEMGHVIARHVLEKNFSTKLAQSVANWFGFRGVIGTDLITMRMQEEEADRMGLLIMSEAGFNPEDRLEYLKDRLKQETEYLAGREPLPEFLSTHPSAETRVKVADSMMPEAKKLFEKKGNMVGEIKGWDEARVPLAAFAQQHAELTAINDQMRPDLLLRRIEGTIGDLVGAWNDFARATHGMADEEKVKKDAAAAQEAIQDAIQELAVEQKIIKEELSEDSGDATATIGPGTESTCMLPTQTTAMSAAEDSHKHPEEEPQVKD